MSSPMKIAICLGRLYMGGIETYAIDLALSLKSKGHEVSIIVFFYVRNIEKKELLLANDINVIDLNLKSGHDLRLPYRLYRILNKISPDIIHLNTIAVLGFIPLLLINKPVLYTIHQMSNNRLIANLYRSVVDGVIAVSNAVQDYQRDELGLFYNKRWKVVYNGVKIPKEYQTYRKSDDINLIVIGRIARDKNPEHSIEILNYLVQNSTLKYNLILVGSPDVASNEYYLEILDKVKKYSLEERVNLTGWQDDVSSYLKNAHGLLMLSESESFGYSAIEAFSYGIPVFSYFIPGGLHEFHKNLDTGIVTDERDPAELAIRIDEVFQDMSTWKKLSKNSKRKSYDYSLQKMVDETERFYIELISNK